jgi:hypothetical protein
MTAIKLLILLGFTLLWLPVVIYGTRWVLGHALGLHPEPDPTEAKIRNRRQEGRA